ncbi:MAG: hypothetical protein V3R85_02710, partial [Alphaproteobacteria bacterium]
AMLEGSLLARKGYAAPVIPDDSPLTESVEAATSEVVPLHRVAAPADEPVPDTPPRPIEFPTQLISPRRRVAIILVALLVLCLIAFALAARGTSNGTEQGTPPTAKSGAIITPVPENTVAVVDPRPTDFALEKPGTVTPVLQPVPRPKLYMLQFASLGGKRRAFEEVVRLQKSIGGILGGRKIMVINSGVGRERYRLRAGSFESLRSAISTCQQVARFDVDCVPIRR